MLKRIVFAVMLVLMFAPVSFAKEKEYGPLIIDVPSGFKSRAMGDYGVELMTHDKQRAVWVVWVNLDGRPLGDFAQFVSEKWHGSKPRYDKSLDAYRFSYTMNGMFLTNVLVRGFDGSDIAVAVQWASASSAITKKQLERILDSIRLR